MGVLCAKSWCLFVNKRDEYNYDLFCCSYVQKLKMFEEVFNQVLFLVTFFL